MAKIIEKINGYELENENLNILYYVNDAKLLTDNEDDLQRFLLAYAYLKKLRGGLRSILWETLL